MIKVLCGKLKRLIFLLLGFSTAVLLLSGCGKTDYESEFIFGKNRIRCNQSVITVTTPFELLAEKTEGVPSDGYISAELLPSDSQKAAAEGHNKNLQILVTGVQLSDQTNVEFLKKEAQTVLEKNAKVSNLNTEISPIDIGNSTGYRLSFSFTESSGARRTDLVVNEYIFSDQNTVWRVIYQYRKGDPAGKYLMDKTAGNIVIGSTF